MKLDRFSVGRKDQQAALPIAICAGCGGDIFPYDEVYVLPDGDITHDDAHCVMEYLRPEKKIAMEAIK